jgi:hypothetical protein
MDNGYIRMGPRLPQELAYTEGDQLPRTDHNKYHARHTGFAEEAGAWRLGPTVYELCSCGLKDSSVTSVTVQRAYFGVGGIPPPSARGRRGGISQPPPGAEQCPGAQRTSSDRLPVSAAFVHGKESGPINYHSPTTKSTTHGEGSDQLPLTEANSHPRHTGVAEAAGAWRLGPTVYGECSFRLTDSSVISVTVQSAYLGGGSIPLQSARDQLPRTEGNGHSRPTGGSLAGGSLRLGAPLQQLRSCRRCGS